MFSTACSGKPAPTAVLTLKGFPAQWQTIFVVWRRGASIEDARVSPGEIQAWGEGFRTGSNAARAWAIVPE
jgi:hypothetical protein